VAILVLGGAGYIGSHLARSLRCSGYEVVLYEKLSTGFRRLAQGFELVEGDIADEAKLRPVLARVDSVIHFAAHASRCQLRVRDPQIFLLLPLLTRGHRHA
jgi:UDP-glucose 4-epimerase